MARQQQHHSSEQGRGRLWRALAQRALRLVGTSGEVLHSAPLMIGQHHPVPPVRQSYRQARMDMLAGQTSGVLWAKA